MAARFTDTADTILVSTAGVPPTGGPFTITAWLYLDIDRNTYSTFLGMNDATLPGTATANDGTSLVTSSSGTLLRAYDNVGRSISGVDMAVGAWYRAAIVVQSGGANWTLYSGAATGSLTANPDAGRTTGPTHSMLYLGSLPGYGDSLEGRVAAVKVWDAALSQAEIEAELAQYEPVRTTDLNRYYPLISDPQDHSGNGYHLTNGTTPVTYVAGPTIPIGPPADAYGQAVYADGPIAWFRGDASTADETGGSAGTLANGATYGAGIVPERVGSQVFSFDGVDDFVSIPHQSKFDLNHPFSVEMWFQADTIPSPGYAGLFNNGFNYLAEFQNGFLQFQTESELGGGEAGYGGVSIGIPHHYVGTWDGTTVRLYLDGSEVATDPLSGTAVTEIDPLCIGAWRGTSDFFDGRIGEVAVYDTVLSPARVAAHYEAGAGVAALPAFVGSTAVNALKAGSVDLDRLYVGAVQVWP